jgi:carboxyl-terminal processing protease
MTRVLVRRLVLLLAPLLLGWSLFMPGALAFSEGQQLYNEAWRTINGAYLDPTFNHQNWYMLREKALKKLNLNRPQDAYQPIRDLLARLDDPFTRFLEPDQYRGLQVSTSGELSGVGLQIGFAEDGQQIVVIAPIEGSPAAGAGMAPGDRITTIDGQSVRGLSLDDAATRLRGPAGTTVALDVTRDGGTLHFTLTRDRISLNPVVAELKQDGSGPKVGYLRLSQFNANAPMEVAHAFSRLEQEGADGFILDLRNNPGGLLTAGIEIGRYLIDEGTIVYTVNRQGVFDSYEARGQQITDKPLVVLVNRGTASASEILAGALQDNGRALLVGDRTFGKGLIQSLFELSDGSGLAVTVAKYETPDHHDINKQGIQPDELVTLESPLAPDEIATAADPQYQAALKLLSPRAIAHAS